MLDSFEPQKYVNRGVVGEGVFLTEIPVEPSEKYSIKVLLSDTSKGKAIFKTLVTDTNLIAIYFLNYKILSGLDFLVYKKYKDYSTSKTQSFLNKVQIGEALDSFSRRIQSVKALYQALEGLDEIPEKLGNFEDLNFYELDVQAFFQNTNTNLNKTNFLKVKSIKPSVGVGGVFTPEDIVLETPEPTAPVTPVAPVAPVAPPSNNIDTTDNDSTDEQPEDEEDIRDDLDSLRPYKNLMYVKADLVRGLEFTPVTSKPSSDRDFAMLLDYNYLAIPKFSGVQPIEFPSDIELPELPEFPEPPEENGEELAEFIKKIQAEIEAFQKYLQEQENKGERSKRPGSGKGSGAGVIGGGATAGSKTTSINSSTGLPVPISARAGGGGGGGGGGGIINSFSELNSYMKSVGGAGGTIASAGSCPYPTTADLRNAGYEISGGSGNYLAITGKTMRQ